MNVEWVSKLPGPVRVAAYFGLQRAIGSHILARWRDLQTWTKFSPTELEAAIEGRLSHLLETATGQSAFYRKLGLVKRPGESAREFLARFPILDRGTLRDQFTELVVDSRRREITSPKCSSPRRYDWMVVKTGGTTGVPTTVVHDAFFRDSGRAMRLFSQSLCGFPLGRRYFRLWGSEQDLLQQQESLSRRVLRNLLAETTMNAFRAKEAELTRHWQTLRRHPHVHHMMAYVDAAVSLATFVEDRRLPAPRLKTIMACAGTVTPEWREILQRVFQAEVFDKYGSRECADIACECSAHSGLHVYSPNVLVEVVDANGTSCAPGQAGRILITLLTNLTFPMIRYEIGDIGSWAPPNHCQCGLAFPRLASLQGREDDMLTTSEGTLLSSAFIRHFVGVALNRQLIREWQFEQIDRNQFIFRYIPLGRDGLERNLAELHETFRQALGQAASVRMSEVADIGPSPSGKTLWVINRVRRNRSGSNLAETKVP